jgi:hypothetical protein
MNITQEKLKELLVYYPDIGIFVWRKSLNFRIVIGTTAGSINGGGYYHIQIDKKKYKSSRLAWLYEFGYWPHGEIDHINHNKMDNRICNLRDVTRSGNQQNKIKANRDSKSGLLGASFAKANGKYRAQITVNGIVKHLGFFDTAEEAHAAYLGAKRIQHSTCTL